MQSIQSVEIQFRQNNLQTKTKVHFTKALRVRYCYWWNSSDVETCY